MEHREAHGHYAAALALAQRLDSLVEQARAHVGLSLALCMTGGDSVAADSHRERAEAILGRPGTQDPYRLRKELVPTAEW